MINKKGIFGIAKKCHLAFKFMINKKSIFGIAKKCHLVFKAGWILRCIVNQDLIYT